MVSFYQTCLRHQQHCLLTTTPMFIAMKPHEIQEKLGLTRIRDRNWFVRRANVVNIQSQVIMNHSCGVLCITKFKKVVGRRGKKLGTISETI